MTTDEEDELRRTKAALADRTRELERVNIMKDEFLATLSHELRTPLNAILGWADMLLERSQIPDDRRGLETIVRNARIQAQLIEDLLDMNRIMSGKIHLDIQHVDLAPVIEAAIDAVRPAADAKQILVRSALDPCQVLGDPQRLQQVIWNLLSNAIKFTPNGGKLDILMRRVNAQVEIRISDTGIGIAEAFLPHLFDRFRQADASTTRRHGGLGLGLSIVKQLVELHGGTVMAESAGANRGSTFVVALPMRAIVEAAQPTSRTEPPRRVSVDLDGVRVLVVDDDADARQMIVSVLEGSGAIPTVAGSADEALVRLNRETFDLIISDIGMPDRDGYQLMRCVRLLSPERGGRTPAIAVTAFARSEDRTRALLAGFQVHLAKPIEPHELVVTAASLTGKVAP